MAIREADGGAVRYPISADREFCIEIEFTVDELNSNLSFGMNAYTEEGVIAFTVSPFFAIKDYAPRKGRNTLRCLIPKNLLNDREYRFELQASIFRVKWILEPGRNAPSLWFRVDQRKHFNPLPGDDPGQVAPAIEWSAV